MKHETREKIRNIAINIYTAILVIAVIVAAIGLAIGMFLGIKTALNIGCIAGLVVIVGCACVTAYA